MARFTLHHVKRRVLFYECNICCVCRISSLQSYKAEAQQSLLVLRRTEEQLHERLRNAHEQSNPLLAVSREECEKYKATVKELVRACRELMQAAQQSSMAVDVGEKHPVEFSPMLEHLLTGATRTTAEGDTSLGHLLAQRPPRRARTSPSPPRQPTRPVFK